MGAGYWLFMALIGVVLLGLFVALIVWLMQGRGDANTATTTSTLAPRARFSIDVSPSARSGSRSTNG